MAFMDSNSRDQAGDAVSEALLPRLKRETHSSHAALEAGIDFMNRFRTPADYRRLLEAFYGVFAPIEDRIGRNQSKLAAWIPDIGNRMRTAALERDLLVLGNESPKQLPMAPVPDYESLAAQMGCLYVLEGSTLGGQVLSRQIGQSLSYTPERGCAFFSGHGTSTGDMWRGFSRGIESYASVRQSEQAEVIQSAVKTFEVFQTWMHLRL